MELHLERAYADTFAAGLAAPDFQLWESCRSAHRLLAYKGKEIYIYQLWFDKPEIVDRLEMQEVSCSICGGFESVWTSLRRGRVTVGHTPTQVYPEVFMWHVFGSDALFKPYKGKFGLHVPVAYRTKVNPLTRQEGFTYALERSVYETTFGV